MDNLLTRTDIKQLTGLSDTAITRALKRGILARPAGKRWDTRWTAAQVDAWIKARKSCPRYAGRDELSFAQVRKQTGYAKSHIRREIIAGKFPAPIRYIKTRPIWDKAAVAQFIAKKSVKSADQLTLEEVESLTLLTEWTIRRYRKAGEFPQPDYSRGKRLPFWNADEIFQYIAKHPPKHDPSHSAIIDAAGQAVTHAKFGWIPDAHTDALNIAGRLYLVVGHRTTRPPTIHVRPITEIPPTVRTVWQVTPNDTAQPTYREQGFANPSK